MKKYAFTLAEVLITLAVIGVIAAITIPSIIANHQKRELETRFVKVYRTLNQAVNLAVAQNGGIETWDWKDGGGYSYKEMDDFVKKYFVPYLNVAKFCPSDKSVNGCFADKLHKTLDGVPRTDKYTVRRYPQVLLADGTSMDFTMFSNCFENNSRCLALHVDINGHKNPAVIGRDFFGFEFYPQTGEFVPMGLVSYGAAYDEQTKTLKKFTKEQIEKNCALDSWYCAAKVVQEGFKINY